MISDIPPQLNVLSMEKPTTANSRKPRLSSAKKAQSMVGLLIYADQDRSLTMARVKAMMDGNAPFDDSELRKHGQEGRTNVNFREAEADVGAAEQPYYDLFAESSTYFQVGLEDPDPQKQVEYSRGATQFFDEMLKEWAGFDFNMQQSIHEFVAFGRGFVMWPDPINWQFGSLKQSKVLVPDGTSCDPDEWELLVVRQSLTVSKLYSKVRNAEAATKVGWNVDATMQAIAKAVPETQSNTKTPDYEKIQEEIRNHDLYATVRSDVIRVANLFVREFSGKISHLIVEEVGTPAPQPGSKKKEPEIKFLFKQIGRYNCFREAIGSIFFDIGDGTWHSVKGLAVKQYPFMEIKNRLNCSIVDNAFINLSILLQAQSGRAEQETALMQLGMMTILPANFEVRQEALQGRMQEALVVEGALTRKLENNTGQYRRPVMREQGNPDTATKVRYDAIKDASLGKGAVNRFYAQLDCIGGEVYRRAINFNLVPEDNGRGPNAMALKFQQKCLDAGIPKQCLAKIKFVRASRNLGNGSMFLRQQTVNETSNLVPMMNEEGRQNWLDDAISVLAGTENVARWNPKKMLNPTLQNEQAYAMIENDVLRDGSPVMVTSTQNGLVHATVHLKAATEAINAIPNGADPSKVLAFIDAVGPHTAEHIQALAADPMRAREIKVLTRQLAQLGKIAEQLRGKIQQAMQQQQMEMQQQQEAMARQAQETQKVMTDEQLKQFETQNKIQLSRIKSQMQLEMRKERHDQDMEISREKAKQDLALKDATTASDIVSQTAKTRSHIASQTAKTEATVNTP